MASDKEFVQEILRLAEVKVLDIDGKKYSTSLNGLAPVKEPEVAALNVGGLTAMKDYLDSNVDGLNLKEIMIHVQGPESVKIISKVIPPFKQREWIMAAKPSLRKFAFGQYFSVEQFIIFLKTLFVENEAAQNVIKVVGNLTDGKTTNYNDDGVTQQVTAKVGITRVENVPVPNPVSLAPFRTFLEVDQPESDFVFRIRSAGVNDAPQCALFEADGGAWELKAVELVKDWLKKNLPDGVTILA